MGLNPQGAAVAVATTGAAAQPTVIDVRRLVKRFGPKVVLHGLDFRVAQGEFVALLGPNGAGKTTFLRILSSLSRQTLGDVRIAGFSLPNESAAVRRRLGVVSHLPLLYGDLTAEENLRFYSRMYGIERQRERIDTVLEAVGLSARRRDLVRTFSRGMQQRLAIARAVLHDPEVLLLDEPHTGLDQDACAMLDAVLRQVAARGRTVVMTSHDLARAADLASRFDVLTHGSIQASVGDASLPQDGLLAFYRLSLEEAAERKAKNGRARTAAETARHQEER
jgi:heme exporter protein A